MLNYIGNALLHIVYSWMRHEVGVRMSSKVRVRVYMRFAPTDNTEFPHFAAVSLDEFHKEFECVAL